MANKMTYTAKEIVKQKVSTWRECACLWKRDFSEEETLEYVKESCWLFDLDENDVKEIFDGCEEPFYYDLETKEIVNGDESDESDDKPLCKNCEIETRKYCDECGGCGSEDESDDESDDDYEVRWCDNEKCPYDGFCYDDVLKEHINKPYICEGCSTGIGLQEREDDEVKTKCEECGCKTEETRYLPSMKDDPSLLGNDYCLPCYTKFDKYEFVEQINV